MKTKTTKTSGIKVTANVKAGGLTWNHTRAGLKVRVGLKAGTTLPMRPNHNAVALTVA
jgi:hypothetical protein